jgi:NAD+ kinase
MHLALYAKHIKDESIIPISILIEKLKALGIQLTFHEFIHRELVKHKVIPSSDDVFSSFNGTQNQQSLPNALLTIGGDGTMLDSLTVVNDSQIPVMGINAGRLGFLAVSSFETIENLIQDLESGNYQLDKRSLLQFESSREIFSTNFALNDFVIHKKDTSSMITVHTYLNGEYLTSYWADGLIVATPTGSTGYSLSCGGPIIFPKSQSLVLTPIAPHNLNMRPVIIPDDNVITFEIEGRSNVFMASLDARSMNITSELQMAIRKADITLNLIRTHNHNFLETLRKKMNWGLDNRNSVN